jgi:hypothetical protein
MKLRIVLIFTAIALLSWISAKDKVVINGQISGNNISKIEYTIPVNGIFNGLMTDSVKPDESGKFRIIVPLEKTGFILLRPR